MPSIKREKIICGLCGIASAFDILISEEIRGACDLDSRPPQDKRETIKTWVQVCPACGYASTDLSGDEYDAEPIVQSGEYRRQLENTSYPSAANAFICYALIQESAKDYAGAGWSSLYAAWICDDEKNGNAALQFRLTSLDYFSKAKMNGQIISDESGSEYAVLADLYRRTAQFEQARKICENGLKHPLSDIFVSILMFEKTIIQKKDQRLP